MSIWLTLVLIVHVIAALGIIGLVLLQHGKGADMGAAFGSGSSGSLFGATGGANFLSRATAGLAAVFFTCTLLLAYFGTPRQASTGSVLEGAAVTAPAPVETGPASQIPGNAPAASGAPASPAAPAK